MQVLASLARLEAATRRAFALLRKEHGEDHGCAALATARFELNQAFCDLHLAASENRSAFPTELALLKFCHEIGQGVRYLEMAVMKFDSIPGNDIDGVSQFKTAQAEKQVEDWLIRIKSHLRPDIAYIALKATNVPQRRL